MAKPTPEDIREYIRAVYPAKREAMGGRKAAEALADEVGVSWRTVYKILSTGPVTVDATTDEYSNPDFIVKATSTAYNRDGKQVIKWVKAERDKSASAIRETFEALKSQLPQLEPREATGDYYAGDLLAVLPFGDPHIGLYSWGEETGEDFDLSIAERDLCEAVDRLVSICPPAENCLIANLGDYFHADNMEARTMRSGHSLDVDSRWAKVLRVGVQIMRQCIESALKYHKTVTVINAIGNHDDHSSVFLTVALSHIYENEPRVIINPAPTAVHYYEFGKVMLAVTHGHSVKMSELNEVAAADAAAMWGRTEFRFGLTGHIHHDSVKEYRGMKVESFRTLAARDAYAASKGYKSGRDLKCIIFHKDFGEVERHTVNIALLNHERKTKVIE